jgi:hypothetical protein
VLFFFGAVQSQGKRPVRPRLKQVWPEVAPMIGGAGKRSVGSGGGRAIGANAVVGGKPTATTDDGAVANAGEWGGGGTPSSTSEEHYRMELPQPSSSWSPCGHGTRHS